MSITLFPDPELKLLNDDLWNAVGGVLGQINGARVKLEGSFSLNTTY